MGPKGEGFDRRVELQADCLVVGGERVKRQAKGRVRHSVIVRIGLRPIV